MKIDSKIISLRIYLSLLIPRTEGDLIFGDCPKGDLSPYPGPKAKFIRSRAFTQACFRLW